MKENSRWNNDAIQFPRLLAEIAATGALTPAVYDELRDLTDLTNDEINQLLDRAQTAWEKIKTEHCPPEQDSFGTRTKPPQDRETVMDQLTRMQNAINWAARSAHVQFNPDTTVYFLGHIIAELQDLDDGAPLKEPEVKS